MLIGVCQQLPPQILGLQLVLIVQRMNNPQLVARAAGGDVIAFFAHVAGAVALCTATAAMTEPTRPAPDTSPEALYTPENYTPTESVGYLLGQAKGRITAAIDAEMAPYDITGAQWITLLHLSCTEVETAGELCKRACVDTGSMTRMLDRLEAKGHTVAVMHSDRSQRERIEALDGFKSGRYEVLVATDIAARGLDIAGVSHVVNYDVPENAEDYVHRIGRTGRAQAVGDAFTLVTPENANDIRDIQRFIGIDNVCAWPNLTLMPDGSINTTIFGKPSHGQMEGAA